MQACFGVLSFCFLIAIVAIRIYILRKQGIDAIEFGKKDKRDFIILPFAALYLYLIVANAFKLPTIQCQTLFQSETIAWLGVFSCLIAILCFLWALVSFKKSFRVGLAENKKQGLITTGVFSFSRNPIYLSFTVMLIGQFLIFPSWILLIYSIIGMITFHQRIRIEEKFLSVQYGNAFSEYCKRVRRYI